MSPTPGTFPPGSRPLSCKGGGLGFGGRGGFALALGPGLGLGLAGLLGWGGGGCSSSLLWKWRSFFLGVLGGFGGLEGRGGVLHPLVVVVVLLLQLLLQLLLLLVSSARPAPGRTLALRVHAPRTPARLQPTRTPQHREDKIGVCPHHPAQIADPHEARPPSAIAPLHAHPAGVGSTRLHADNLKTETKCRCILAAF